MSWFAQLLERCGWRTSTGARGETLASQYLKKNGYQILGRNLRTRVGEIDIVAIAPDQRTVVIVEVKAGTGEQAALMPEVHVNTHKQRKLANLASQLVQRYRLENRPVRFDVVGVDCPPGQPAVIRHHPGAFESHL